MVFFDALNKLLLELVGIGKITEIAYLEVYSGRAFFRLLLLFLQRSRFRCILFKFCFFCHIKTAGRIRLQGRMRRKK